MTFLASPCFKIRFWAPDIIILAEVNDFRVLIELESKTKHQNDQQLKPSWKIPISSTFDLISSLTLM
jgi:hypothetical protein